MQKFVITKDGVLRFGDVSLHKDLLPSSTTPITPNWIWQNLFM